MSEREPWAPWLKRQWARLASLNPDVVATWAKAFMFVAIGVAALIYAFSSTYRSAAKGRGAVSVLSGRYCDRDGCSLQSPSSSTALQTAIPSFGTANPPGGREVVWDEEPGAPQPNQPNANEQPEASQ